MYIDRITYIATNWAAVDDDIFTLDITGLKNGVPVRNVMISGHSLLLTGGGYAFDADVDTLIVSATDLDFDGHVIDVGGLQQRIPRTGSMTRTYQFDVRQIGAVEITKPLIDPQTGLVSMLTEQLAPLPQPPAVSGVAAGAGIGALAVIGLLLAGAGKGG